MLMPWTSSQLQAPALLAVCLAQACRAQLPQQRMPLCLLCMQLLPSFACTSQGRVLITSEAICALGPAGCRSGACARAMPAGRKKMSS